MAYTKLDENNRSIKVSEAEHLEEFMATIPKVKCGLSGPGKAPLDLVSIGGGTTFGMFRLVLEGKLLVPDTVRARVVAAMNYQLLRELEKVESMYEPEKRKYTVDMAVAPFSVGMTVEATSKEEAEELAQRAIDSRQFGEATIKDIANAVAASVETVEADDGAQIQ